MSTAATVFPALQNHKAFVAMFSNYSVLIKAEHGTFSNPDGKPKQIQRLFLRREGANSKSRVAESSGRRVYLFYKRVAGSVTLPAATLHSKISVAPITRTTGAPADLASF